MALPHEFRVRGGHRACVRWLFVQRKKMNVANREGGPFGAP